MTPPQPAPPVLALTQGDPAGVGPEILVKLLAGRFQAVGGVRAGVSGPPDSAAPDWSEDRGESPRSDAGAEPAPVGSGGGSEAARDSSWLPLLIAERAALAPPRGGLPRLSLGPAHLPWRRRRSRAEIERLAAAGAVPVLDPVGGGAYG